MKIFDLYKYVSGQTLHVRLLPNPFKGGKQIMDYSTCEHFHICYAFVNGEFGIFKFPEYLKQSFKKYYYDLEYCTSHKIRLSFYIEIKTANNLEDILFYDYIVTENYSNDNEYHVDKNKQRYLKSLYPIGYDALYNYKWIDILNSEDEIYRGNVKSRAFVHYRGMHQSDKSVQTVGQYYLENYSEEFTRTSRQIKLAQFTR
jgi:hypothetical protein